MIRPVLMLLLGLLMGCPETPEPEPPSSPAPVGDTPPAAEDRLICAAETLESAVTSPTRPVRVVIHDGSRGALAWVRDDSLHVGSFTGSAVAPHSESQPMVADTELDLVARMSTGTLIVSKGPCVSEGESRRCLYGQFFDDGPEPASTVARVALAGAPTSRRRVRTDTGVYIAHAFRENTLSVTTFEPTPEGEVHTRQQPLGTEVEAALSPVEVLGMAAHEDRWAVFWRFGAPELPQSQVVLSLPDQEHPSRQLKHALSLDTVLWRGGSIRVVASFEFARPSLFRVATNGRLRWLPRMVPHQGGLPPPNHHHFNGRLAAHEGRVMLEVTTAAGDPLTRLGPFGGPETLGHRLVDVSRSEGGFVVGYFQREGDAWALHVDRIRCPAEQPPLEPSPGAT